MIKITKKIGETPLEALSRFRQKNPEYEDVRLSYAGRLDPMASGTLLLLEGKENDERELYLPADKIYSFELLLGAASDSFDLLGLPTDYNPGQVIKEDQLRKMLSGFKGGWRMKYPPYSAKPVEVAGKQVPLWQLARSNQLPKKLPAKDVEIYVLKPEAVRCVSGSYITSYITKNISLVSGDFRQKKIIEAWQETIDKEDKFQIIRLKLHCSSGTYVRRLAEEIGKKLSVPALAFSITRTDVVLS